MSVYYKREFDTDYYRELSGTIQHVRKVEKARDIIAEALRFRLKGYVSFSGGKDSTVLMFLVRGFYPQYPAVYRDADTMMPESREYIDIIACQYSINLQVIQAPYSIWDYYRRHPEDLDSETHHSDDEQFEGFKTTMTRFSREGGFGLSFWGLRAEESQARKMNLLTRGALYQLGEMTICNPLASWTGEDVFAYLVGYNIPIHPAYTRCKFCPPERLRVGGWTPDRANNKNGQWMRHLQYYYPELYMRITELRRDLAV